MIDPKGLPSVDLASEAALAAAYRRIPPVLCQGLCQDSCGPIVMTAYEAGRVARAAAKAGVPVELVDTPLGVAPQVDGDWTCPLLVDGRCSTYQARPAVCRAWGAVPAMPCPWGCTPVGNVDVPHGLIINPLGDWADR